MLFATGPPLPLAISSGVLTVSTIIETINPFSLLTVNLSPTLGGSMPLGIEKV